MHGKRTTTVILCRHGESEGNRDGRFGGHGPAPLTELGRTQARATGKALALSKIDTIYTSDLPRAVETARLIAEAIGVAPVESAALRERSVGELTGLTFEQARVQHADAYAALMRGEPHANPPGGESYAQCRARASAFLEHALTRHPGQRVLLVSHNITMLQLIQHILGFSCEVPARARFQLDHCALHRFERGEGGEWRVIALNERSHLQTI